MPNHAQLMGDLQVGHLSLSAQLHVEVETKLAVGHVQTHLLLMEEKIVLETHLKTKIVILNRVQLMEVYQVGQISQLVQSLAEMGSKNAIEVVLIPHHLMAEKIVTDR